MLLIKLSLDCRDPLSEPSADCLELGVRLLHDSGNLVVHEVYGGSIDFGIFLEVLDLAERRIVGAKT